MTPQHGRTNRAVHLPCCPLPVRVKQRGLLADAPFDFPGSVRPGQTSWQWRGSQRSQHSMSVIGTLIRLDRQSSRPPARTHACMHAWLPCMAMATICKSQITARLYTMVWAGAIDHATPPCKASSLPPSDQIVWQGNHLHLSPASVHGAVSVLNKQTDSLVPGIFMGSLSAGRAAGGKRADICGAATAQATARRVPYSLRLCAVCCADGEFRQLPSHPRPEVPRVRPRTNHASLRLDELRRGQHRPHQRPAL